MMASEMGVLPVAEEKIIEKWRLQPGKMLLIDLEAGRIISDDEIKASLSTAHPYEEWLARAQIKLEDLPTPEGQAHVSSNLTVLDQQKAFGYTQEDLKFLHQSKIANIFLNFCLVETTPFIENTTKEMNSISVI